MNDESCYTGMRKRKDCEETDEKTWQEAGQKSIKSVRLYVRTYLLLIPTLRLVRPPFSFYSMGR